MSLVWLQYHLKRLYMLFCDVLGKDACLENFINFCSDVCRMYMKTTRAKIALGNCFNDCHFRHMLSVAGAWMQTHGLPAKLCYVHNNRLLMYKRNSQGLRVSVDFIHRHNQNRPSTVHAETRQYIERSVLRTRSGRIVRPPQRF